MNLPAGFEQIDLFQCLAPESVPVPKSKPKRRQKREGTVYRCGKCGKSMEIDIPAVAIVCGCGKQMKREEEK